MSPIRPSRCHTYRGRFRQNTDGWRTWLVQDQRFVSNRTDVLSYETPVLDHEVRLEGAPIADIFAKTTGTDGDFVVKLIDVYPPTYAEQPEMGGYELPIALDIFRGRYRKSFSNPSPIPAGKVQEYKFRLPTGELHLQAGHRIMVQIQSTLFPVYDRNPQTYVPNILFAKPSDYHKATVTIMHGPDAPQRGAATGGGDGRGEGLKRPLSGSARGGRPRGVSPPGGALALPVAAVRQALVRKACKNAGLLKHRGRHAMGRVRILAAALRPTRLVLLAAAAGILAAGPAGAFAAAGVTSLHRIGTLAVPGKPLTKFDIGFVNADGIYAFADRSNRSLDFFSAATGQFLGRATGFGSSGPKGVVAVGRQEFWAGDGDSGTVKIVDVRTRRIVASILTEKGKATDELTYDPRDHLVAVVSKHGGPPFLNFISTRTRSLVGHLQLTQATDGAEQSVWDPATGLIYLSLPVLNDVEAHGAVAINPRTYALLKLIPVEKCVPAGLALGPQDDLLVGCSDDAVAAGFPAQSLIVNAASGKIVARLPRVGGSDEVWSDDAAGRYYLAAVANTGGPVLGVVDSHARSWVANLPTGPNAHSVAADARTGKVFVPIAAGSAGTCHRGCIAVYGQR